jgi:hypothetical protein
LGGDAWMERRRWRRRVCRLIDDRPTIDRSARGVGGISHPSTRNPTPHALPTHGQVRSESSQLTAKATELVQAGKKDRALLVLKVRRLREEESSKAEAQLLNVEKLVSVLFGWLVVDL